VKVGKERATVPLHQLLHLQVTQHPLLNGLTDITKTNHCHFADSYAGIPLLYENEEQRFVLFILFFGVILAHLDPDSLFQRGFVSKKLVSTHVVGYMPSPG
jgi:hypothetical protein